MASPCSQPSWAPWRTNHSPLNSCPRALSPCCDRPLTPPFNTSSQRILGPFRALTVNNMTAHTPWETSTSQPGGLQDCFSLLTWDRLPGPAGGSCSWGSPFQDLPPIHCWLAFPEHSPHPVQPEPELERDTSGQPGQSRVKLVSPLPGMLARPTRCTSAACDVF